MLKDGKSTLKMQTPLTRICEAAACLTITCKDLAALAGPSRSAGSLGNLAMDIKIGHYYSASNTANQGNVR